MTHSRAVTSLSMSENLCMTDMMIQSIICRIDCLKTPSARLDASHTDALEGAVAMPPSNSHGVVGGVDFTESSAESPLVPR